MSRVVLTRVLVPQRDGEPIQMPDPGPDYAPWGAPLVVRGEVVVQAWKAAGKKGDDKAASETTAPARKGGGDGASGADLI